MKEGMPALRSRLAFKVIGNFVSFAVSAALQFLIPRTLGPQSYGVFGFVTSFFTSVCGILDSGTSTAYYSTLSRGRVYYGLVTVYARLITVLSLLSVVVTAGLLAVPTLATAIWPGVSSSVVVLGFLWAISVWWGQLVEKTNDAMGMTVPAERLRVFFRIVLVLLVLGAYVLKILDLKTALLLQICVNLLMVFATSRKVVNELKIERSVAEVSREGAISAAPVFWNGAKPLIFYSIVSSGVLLLERWVLQLSGGSEQQGYYNFALQIASIFVLVTSAVSTILNREFAAAFHRENHDFIVRAFHTAVSVSYWVAAGMASFIAINAEFLTHVVAGKEFASASIVVFVMSYYPVHQVLGQLCGVVLFSRGDTSYYRNIGLSTSVVGLLVVALLVAPRWGGGLGALGLALKAVILQVISVNWMLHGVVRRLNMKFGGFLLRQFLAVCSFTSIAFVVQKIVLSWFGGVGFVSLAFEMMLFTLISLVGSRLFPLFFGLTKQDLIWINTELAVIYRYFCKLLSSREEKD
ncbi:MAG: hypothetical protein IPJ84_13285 [Bdellovibrionales bacterium]|nr:hypothetical protein [Bdellovibrionales bacterium]